MSKLKVGETKVNLEELGKRDAFHVPGVIVSSNMDVKPGDSVKFIDDTTTIVATCRPSERHGIADPFLRLDNLKGRAFWVMLEPELVGDLNHKFEIRGFPNSNAPEARELSLLREQVKNLMIDLAHAQTSQSYDEDEDDGCRGCY